VWKSVVRSPQGSAAEEYGYPLLKPLVARDHEREGPTPNGVGGAEAVRPEGFRRGYPYSSAAEPSARTSLLLIDQQGSQQDKVIGLPVYWKAELRWCLEEVMI